MTARCFVDTNVVVYATDGSEPAKWERASRIMQAVWASRTATLSTQVLQELYAVATRGDAPMLTREDAEEVVRELGSLRVVGIDVQTVCAAVARARRRRMSIWDALIVQSAVESGCTVLLTEDLAHGEAIDGVRVVDPFQGDEDEVLALFG